MMNDTELTDKQINELRIKKLKEIDLRFADSKQLSTSEYLDRLHSILKNAILMLERRLIQNKMTDTVALLTISERVYYLIDSAESKHVEKDVGITITWASPEKQEEVNA